MTTLPSPQETLVLVPARMASTRLPGKPLADIAGLPMIIQVVRRASEAGIGRVVVATDDERVLGEVRRHGGEAVMTDIAHQSGSDRIWEAVTLLDPDGKYKFIVNVQGDLPTIEPALIAGCLATLAESSADIATLAAVITDEAERNNPNVVKAVGTGIGDNRMRALYFTRATAPWGEGDLFHHIGLYAYRREALERFVGLKPSPLEMRERLEQLRALEAGMRIDIAIVDTVPLGVDTPHDLEKARAMLA
ncbi:MAG: 3-deoxy-manno-octulosonate cytidylyltransferase [Nitratireductor sp.]